MTMVETNPAENFDLQGEVVCREGYVMRNLERE